MNLTTRKFKVIFYGLYFVLLVIALFFSPFNYLVIVYLFVDYLEQVQRAFKSISTLFIRIYFALRVSVITIFNILIVFRYFENTTVKVLFLGLSIIVIELIRLFVKKIPTFVTRINASE